MSFKEFSTRQEPKQTTAPATKPGSKPTTQQPGKPAEPAAAESKAKP